MTSLKQIHESRGFRSISASLDSRTVIQQAIIKATQRLSYASVCEVQAKAVSYIVAGKDVFISLNLYQEISSCFSTLTTGV